jgi:hypothetical protein
MNEITDLGVKFEHLSFRAEIMAWSKFGGGSNKATLSYLLKDKINSK